MRDQLPPCATGGRCHRSCSAQHNSPHRASPLAARSSRGTAPALPRSMSGNTRKTPTYRTRGKEHTPAKRGTVANIKGGYCGPVTLSHEEDSQPCLRRDRCAYLLLKLTGQVAKRGVSASKERSPAMCTTGHVHQADCEPLSRPSQPQDQNVRRNLTPDQEGNRTRAQYTPELFEQPLPLQAVLRRRVKVALPHLLEADLPRLAPLLRVRVPAEER